jgi:pimeloyl-ACP methyl ester carboxylesterase
LLVLIFVVAAIVIGAAAVLMFNEPVSPPELTSVTRALDAVDFSSLPEPQTFKARDGTSLIFRAYAAQGNETAVLIHGATLTSASMHAVAQALHARGATAYSLGMRGHEGGGRKGDVDYIGQLADDIEDFVQTLPPKQAGERRALLGFSAGGGLALRFTGRPRAKAFDRFVLVAPGLYFTTPTVRPGYGGFVGAAMPRILVLVGLNRVGVTAFNYLPTTAFAVPENAKHSTTRVWSLRLAASFEAGPGFLDDLRQAPGSVALVVGSADELFFADQYEPLLKPVRPDLDVTVMPGLNHMDMIVKPVAVELLAAKTLEE